MTRILIVLCTFAVTATAAEDSWLKVKQLKTGVELRVYKKAAKQPVNAMFDEATDENLVVMIKNEQLAIPKDEIDRIDFRAPKSVARITKESRTVVKDQDTAAPRMPGSSPGPSTTTSSGVTFSGKGDFETVYRRMPSLK